MATPTQWTWVWASSGRWWRTGQSGVLQSMGLQSWTRLSDWTTTTVLPLIFSSYDIGHRVDSPPPIPWRRKWQTTPVSLPGKSHGQKSLVGCSPWGLRESGTAEQLTLSLIPNLFPSRHCFIYSNLIFTLKYILSTSSFMMSFAVTLVNNNFIFPGCSILFPKNHKL